MAHSYITRETLEVIGNVPPDLLANLENKQPGVIEATCQFFTAYVDSVLGKRYAIPFDLVSPPMAIQVHLCALVSAALWIKIGYIPSSGQDALIAAAKAEAQAYLKEAADSEKGLIELPRKTDPLAASSAVAKAAPLAYSEASPFTWVDRQRQRVRNEGR